MIRLLIYIFLIYIIYVLVKKVLVTGPKISGRESSSGVISEMVQDPVCKTYIPRNEAYREVIGGKEILFCSKECAERYKNK
jgi:YHS domain-containing protein